MKRCALNEPRPFLLVSPNARSGATTFARDAGPAGRQWVTSPSRRFARPETFDFLGLTHIAGHARDGKYQLQRRTSRKNWLNDGAKGFIRGLALGDTVFDHKALTVRALAPEQLLAMKLCAWRDAIDFEDARLLLTKVMGDRAKVWAMVEPFLLPGRETTACYASTSGKAAMTQTTLADAACAALRGEHLLVRQWASDTLRDLVAWGDVRQPQLQGDELSVAAALVEVMASRAGQIAPRWTADVPTASRSIYFVPVTLRRSRKVSETQGPEPLRRRRIYAMPDYLTFA